MTDSDRAALRGKIEDLVHLWTWPGVARSEFNSIYQDDLARKADTVLTAIIDPLVDALETIAVNCEIGSPANWRDLGKIARAALAQERG